MDEHYEKGYTDGLVELEKLASAGDGLGKTAGLRSWAKGKNYSHLKKVVRKRGLKFGFRDLSGSRKAMGIGALLAAGVGGHALGKRKKG